MPSPAILFLAEAAHAAASADNSQPWQLTWDGSYFTIGYDTARVAGKTFPPDEPATVMTMGAVIENVDQAARALGLVPSWTFPEMHVRPVSEYGRLSFDAATPVSLAGPRQALFTRHTNRLRYGSSAPSRDLYAAPMREIEGEARCQCYVHRASLTQIGRLVQTASEVRFQTQELHEWLMASLRFGSDAMRGDGLDVRTLNLPPGGSYFLRWIRDWRRMVKLNRVGGYRFFASMEGRIIGSAPAVAAIIGPRGYRATLDAGRLMERVWIALNGAGFAVQPFYALSDQLHRMHSGRVPPQHVAGIRALERELPDVFELAVGETVHILLRFGLPGRNVPRSRRLPLAAVFRDRSLN